MKKLLLILFVLLIFVTGCTKIDMDNKDTIVESIKKNNTLKNVNFEGYSYYIPRGLKLLEKTEYNAYLMDKENNKYYIYVDVVSRYHKIKKVYKVDINAYYSRRLTNGKKFGYVEINRYDDNYFVEAMYNYMKVEVYTKEKDLYDTLKNISLVLSSVKYNDQVLNTIVGENILSYKEENYNIFKTKKKATDFLDYVREYDYEEDESDEDNIKVEVEE